jgi:hypothetical protein
MQSPEHTTMTASILNPNNKQHARGWIKCSAEERAQALVLHQTLTSQRKRQTCRCANTQKDHALP